MKDGKWTDWMEPLEILMLKVQYFLYCVKKISSLDEFPQGGKLVEGRELYTRKEELAKALAAFVMVPRKIWTTDFLANYVYVSSVYEEAYALVFEYIGENEHQFDLHGDDFAQDEVALLEDFALYIENWSSPYWRGLE